MQRHVYADAAEAAVKCGDDILEHLRQRLAQSETAALAISGGTSPTPMFEHMAAVADFDWSRVHLFWVDERAVPPGNPQSNFRLAEEHLIRPAGIPAGNVHRVCAEQSPKEAAQKYAAELSGFFHLEPGTMPRFDVIHRGMGPDAHTASLFPGEELIRDTTQLAAAVFVPKMSQYRITLLPGVLRAARYTVMLVTGDDKAEAARDVLSAPFDPLRYPAQIAIREGAEASWFLDEPAAKLIE